MFYEHTVIWNQMAPFPPATALLLLKMCAIIGGVLVVASVLGFVATSRCDFSWVKRVNVWEWFGCVFLLAMLIFFALLAIAGAALVVCVTFMLLTPNIFEADSAWILPTLLVVGGLCTTIGAGLVVGIWDTLSDFFD